MLVLVAFFVSVNVILPSMGFALCIFSLLFDLIHSLKSEKKEFEKEFKDLKASLNVPISNLDRRVNAAEIEIGRMNRSGIFNG
jgi:hypothetical protein